MSSTRPIRAILPVMVLAFALVLTSAACTASKSAGSAPSSSPAAPAAKAIGLSTSSGLQQAYVSAIRRVLPSVVEIRTACGLGSGVVFDESGDIVTNAHVVGNATSFDVFLAGWVTSLPARLRGSYQPDDLAIIRLTRRPHLVPSRFADSSKAQVGEIVLAMGNPLGLPSSGTDGIISATGRIVPEPQQGGSPATTAPRAPSAAPGHPKSTWPHQ
jgi:putative serine protease PepD